MRVRCDDKSGCPAEADAKIENTPTGHGFDTLDEWVTPDDWTDNRGLGGKWQHYCPQHPQSEIAGG